MTLDRSTRLQSNRQLRRSTVPFGGALVRVRRREEALLLARTADQLAADRHAARGEIAGQRERRQTNIAERPREAGIGSPEGVDRPRRARRAVGHRRRRKWVSCHVEDVDAIESSQILFSNERLLAHGLDIARRRNAQTRFELLPDTRRVIIWALPEPLAMQCRGFGLHDDVAEPK